MNTIGSNIIQYIFKFCQEQELKLCRGVNKNINNIVTYLYFSIITVDVSKLLNNNTYAFMNFVNKYGLYLNIKGVHGMQQLNNYVTASIHPKLFKSILFKSNFSSEIKTPFSHGIQHLKFNDGFGRKIYQGILPESLITLEFERYFYEIKEHILPLSLTSLIIGSGYGYMLKPNILPPNLTHLEFKHWFNCEILPNALPHGLIYLNLGEQFNQKIQENILPSTIEKLIFGEQFNQDLNEKNLSANLKHLSLPKLYNATLSINGFRKITNIKSYDVYLKY
jgi:hypothetical protein